ncbi:transposase [Falsiroseomonas algicola]|uniref:transposase n=1 Tax=Falsiroseomonas algicola TaxID=2716930 RepID=UPI0038B367FB
MVECKIRSPCGADARAGRLAPLRTSRRPANITILPLPPKCPELNVIENVWRFTHDNWRQTASSTTSQGCSFTRGNS